MTIERYENQIIANADLPTEWRSKSAQKEFLDFLQTNWAQRSVFYDDGETRGSQQFLVPAGLGDLRTQGYVGTVAYKGLRINVYPKVFARCKNDGSFAGVDEKLLMHNLVQWLVYVAKADYPYIRIAAEAEKSDNLLALFISLYVRYVQAALSRGLYYRYEEKAEDLQTVRGKLDGKDYVLRKYPNGLHDRFRCEYSTFEFDNLLNRIVKYTLTLLHKNKNTTAENQKRIRSLLAKLGDVTDIRCTPQDCDKIRLNKLQERYEIVLRLSKMFLLNQTANFSEDSHDSFCFLFPMHVLFEGFIYGYMRQAFGAMATVTAQKSKYLIDSIRLGEQEYRHAFKMRFDISVKHGETEYILDTKYKALSRFAGNADFLHDITGEVHNGDLYQVLTYAVSRGSKRVFLLYPQYRSEPIDPNPAVMKQTVRVNNTNSTVQICIARVPFVFEEDSENTEENLKTVLSRCLGIA